MQSAGFFGLSATNIDGQPFAFSSLQGKKAIVVVNVASKCGLTDNHYKQLNSLYAQYQQTISKKIRTSGLEILGFPCNQFKGQEPGTDAEVKECVLATFAVTFPLFSKVQVNGPNASPVFQYLRSNSSLKQDGEVREIEWNFGKFLIDGQGNVVEYFNPKREPNEMAAKIKELLGI